MVHKVEFSGAHSGELAFIYLGGFISIFLAGPGRFSIDKRVFGAGRNGAAKKQKS